MPSSVALAPDELGIDAAVSVEDHPKHMQDG